MEYAQSLSRLVAYFAQNQVFDGVVQTITTDALMGSNIGGNYENMVKKYLADDKIRWTHFLSIEDDMSFPADGLHTLARHKLAIVGANYPTNKGYPLRFTTSQGPTQVVTNEESTGIEEVNYLPQGFTLVAREVYEKMKRPWFLNGYNTVTETYICQDYYFSERAKEAGFKSFVDHDVSKQMLHVGASSFSYRNVPVEEEISNG